MRPYTFTAFSLAVLAMLLAVLFETQRLFAFAGIVPEWGLALFVCLAVFGASRRVLAGLALVWALALALAEPFALPPLLLAPVLALAVMLLRRHVTGNRLLDVLLFTLVLSFMLAAGRALWYGGAVLSPAALSQVLGTLSAALLLGFLAAVREYRRPLARAVPIPRAT